MASLDAKIDAARLLAAGVLERYSRPAVMCSFGKDSMVLLHLLLAAGIRLPVIFHRDPWFPQKYAFAERVAREWGLALWDYPPSAVTMWEGKGIMAFTNHYQIGPQREDGRIPDLALPKNIVPPERGRSFLCGRDDVFGRPLGTFDYPWDVVFIGHKSADEDQIAGRVPLAAEIVCNGVGPDAAFPLRDWTHEEVWAYTERFGVPVQEDRYVRGADGRWREVEDKWANSDYWHACIRCLDRREGAEVICPKTGQAVPNVSERVVYRDIVPEYCRDGREEAAQ